MRKLGKAVDRAVDRLVAAVVSPDAHSYSSGNGNYQYQQPQAVPYHYQQPQAPGGPASPYYFPPPPSAATGTPNASYPADFAPQQYPYVPPPTAPYVHHPPVPPHPAYQGHYASNQPQGSPPPRAFSPLPPAGHVNTPPPPAGYTHPPHQVTWSGPNGAQPTGPPPAPLGSPQPQHTYSPPAAASPFQAQAAFGPNHPIPPYAHAGSPPATQHVHTSPSPTPISPPPAAQQLYTAPPSTQLQLRPGGGGQEETQFIAELPGDCVPIIRTKPSPPAPQSPKQATAGRSSPSTPPTAQVPSTGLPSPELGRVPTLPGQAPAAPAASPVYTQPGHPSPPRRSASQLSASSPTTAGTPFGGQPPAPGLTHSSSQSSRPSPRQSASAPSSATQSHPAAQTCFPPTRRPSQPSYPHTQYIPFAPALSYSSSPPGANSPVTGASPPNTILAQPSASQASPPAPLASYPHQTYPTQTAPTWNTGASHQGLPIRPFLSSGSSSPPNTSIPTSPVRVPGQQDAPVVRKILSLDGGGVRGLSTIMILRNLMKAVEHYRGVKLEPWQEFDMIGGSSTGGLLAIMLGRLRMSLDECEEAYLNLSRKIFTPTHDKANIPGRLYDFFQANGKFNSKPLEESIKDILRKRGLPETELIKEENSDACKTFVCAVRGNDSPAVIRSYKTMTNDGLFEVCKIWEAVRATSATSRLFEPITIGPSQQEFVGGALRHNNPIDLVDLESSSVWPQQDRLIISIGTGSAPGSFVDGNLPGLMQTLSMIATDTEEKNKIFRAAHSDMAARDRLFRFNVYQGLANVGFEEFKAVDRVAYHTNHYLGQYDTTRDIEKCASALRSSGQRLSYISGEG